MDQYKQLKEQNIPQIHNQLEISWKQLIITATIDVPQLQPNGKKKNIKTQKTILNNLRGTLKPGHFTAILGPSGQNQQQQYVNLYTGSGKTTLLNFLSGRLVAQNLQIYGELFINGEQLKNIEKYSNQIAYVMQDDILLPTFTPREAFRFVAALRLPLLSKEQKLQRVEDLIIELGLQKCADTKVGNAMIRGVSGGERKRTSIGVELLTDPNVLFLDEPTTGLDSSTALQVVEVLRHLALKGVNIISTIHQPSSEIFEEFDQLLLLVRGNIIYQGEANQAIGYLDKLGFKCPKFSNPTDFFMKLMNEEGLKIEYMQEGKQNLVDEEIEKDFIDRMKILIKSYKQSLMYKQLEPTIFDKIVVNDKDFNSGWCVQFYQLLRRGFINEIRNPMDVRLKIFQQVIFAGACLLVFNNLGSEGMAAIQNRNGVLFFLITMQCFGSIQGAIATFSGERNLFLRERLNKSYEVGPYFWGKSLCEFPFHLLYPVLSIFIVYWIIGLNQVFWWKPFMLAFIAILAFWAGTSYGLLISVLVPRLELAMALTPILIIPLMIMGGFFVNGGSIPVFISWIQYISMFHYGFNAAALNEYSNENIPCPLPSQPGQQEFSFQYNITSDIIQQEQYCQPLQQLNIQQPIEFYLLIQFGLGLVIRIIAVIGMYLISNPKRPTIQDPLLDEEIIQFLDIDKQSQIFQSSKKHESQHEDQELFIKQKDPSEIQNNII